MARLAPVATDTVIDIGDLVWLDTDEAKPASALTDQESEAANQEAFHDAFLGVAMQRSADGDTDDIRVATTGVFEYVTPSGTFELGDLLGMDEAASGTALEDQQIDAVATANLAIGRCARRVAANDTKVLVSIQSTILYGGPQAAA